MANRGYLLPVVIALGFGVSAVSVVAMQTVAMNSITLGGQYYNSVAREAAQAGIAAATNCIRINDMSWSEDNNAATNLTPATGCNGTVDPNKSANVADDNAFTSTYSVGALQAPGGSTTAKVLTSVGTVSVKGPLGSVVKKISTSVRTFGIITTTSSGQVSQISTGPSTACAVAAGWAYCWGDNTYGQVGNGRYVRNNIQKVPVDVASNAAPAIAVAGIARCLPSAPGAVTPSSQSSMAAELRLAATNTCNQASAPATPAQPASDLVNPDGSKKVVVKVSVGTSHTCAIAKDNAADTTGATQKAYCWGLNSNGQLGDRTSAAKLVPTAVDTSASVASSPALPIGCGGKIVCTTPAQPGVVGSVLAGKAVVDISAGPNFTCALTSDGLVACWGDNTYGQLGRNNRTDTNFPVATAGGALVGKTVTKLAQVKDGQTMCAIDNTETAYCWGQNYSGQVGNGNSANNATSTSACGTNTGFSYDLPATNTGFDVLQPVAVQTSQKFQSITINGTTGATYQTGTSGSGTQTQDDGAYITGLTAGSSSTPNSLFRWGGTTSYSVTSGQYCGQHPVSTTLCVRPPSNSTTIGSCPSPPALPGCSGGVPSYCYRNCWAGTTWYQTYGAPPPGCVIAPPYQTTSTTYVSDYRTSGARSYDTQDTPVQLFTAAGNTLYQKQFTVSSGNAYNGGSATDYFCTQTTENNVYCGHSNGGMRGETGKGTTFTCSNLLACSPTTAGTTPQLVKLNGALSGQMPIDFIDTGAKGFTEQLVGFACALARNQVYCWGANSWGQVGDDSTTNRYEPTPIDMTAITAGGGGGTPDTTSFTSAISF